MLLKVESLAVHYGAAEAVRDVSLHVDEGSIVSLIGANGAGKTSILRAISGLERPTTGEIRFLDQRIDQMPCEAIAKLHIGHCPEGRRLFPMMSILENLLMGAYLRNDKQEIARDLAKTYGRFPVLRERSSQLASSLSGGEQQMLAIARAMMGRPKLLLLDEPSIGLAPLFIRDIARIIEEIHRGGVSVLLVEQNSALSLELSDYVYVLETGCIAHEGKPSDLLSDDRVRNAYLGT